MHKKLVRITTIPLSLDKLLQGQPRFMSNFYKVTAVSSPDGLEKISQTENVDIFAVEMTRKITPIKDLKAVLRLYRFLKKEKPFIVHTHTPKAGTLGMLASKLAGVPVRLHTVAGLPLLEVSGKKRKLLDIVEKITYGCATKVYPNSKGLESIIKELGYCRPEKLKVIGNGSSNGINTEFFNPEAIPNEAIDNLRSNLGIMPDDSVFIFVGRLVSDKGINELVKAFKDVANEFENVKLLLVGSREDDLDPLLPETLNEIQSNKNIISAGYQNDVRPYLAISTVLAFPSYREGFPNVVMQAGAMGLPCIVTDINGCNEIIEQDVNGIIIPVKNSEMLYIAMKKLLKDNAYRRYLEENARDRIISRFNQQVIWESILKEYKSFEENV
jgi:glycosyltransferase involved in cell wall biosynthesis